MRSHIVTTFFVVLCFITQEAKGQFVSYNQIENGKYEATVYYNSNSTRHRAKYQLVVTVFNDAVTTIHFDNKGSVHSGYNNEGYSYSGGDLRFSRDYNGKITGASTTVDIRYSNGTRVQFKIEL